MANEIAKKELTPLQRFNGVMKDTRTQEYLASVLGNKKDQFVTTLISAVANNENLQVCEPMSLMYTAMKATALGLPIDPNLGYAAMIPFKDNKSGKTLCQFQIQRDGWMELLMRTGQVKFVANEVVYDGQLVKKNKFTGEYVFDEDAKKSDKVIGYMAYIKLTNGFEKTVYWTIEECKAHALRYSQTYKKGYGVWKDNFDAMALKTVLKHIIKKYAPKSVEVLNAISDDQAVFTENNEAAYRDNMPDDQDQPDTASAKEKAEAVKAQVEAMKERRNGKAPEADTETGEIFNQE
jgi:recombination protein RecT